VRSGSLSRDFAASGTLTVPPNARPRLAPELTSSLTACTAYLATLRPSLGNDSVKREKATSALYEPLVVFRGFGRKDSLSFRSSLKVELNVQPNNVLRN